LAVVCSGCSSPSAALLLLAAQTEQPVGQSTATGAAQDNQRAEESERSSDIWLSADQNARKPDCQPQRNADAEIEPSKV
jgi:hypothetical protein